MCIAREPMPSGAVQRSGRHLEICTARVEFRSSERRLVLVMFRSINISLLRSKELQA